MMELLILVVGMIVARQLRSSAIRILKGEALWSLLCLLPEVPFTAVPFATMAGVSLWPTWWWTVSLIPMSLAALLIVATFV